MEVAILAGLALAINKTVSVIKAVVNKDKNGYVTPVLVWAVGVLGVLLAAHAKVTSDLVIPGVQVALGSLDTSSHVLLAWVLGSSGSFGFDIKKALDNGDTAAEASLLK